MAVGGQVACATARSLVVMPSIAWAAPPGALAMLATPAATSLGVTVVIAWVLMGVGVVHLFSTWHAESVAHGIMDVTVGILYFVAGAAILRHPLWGDATLTMILGAVFVAEGALGLAICVIDHDHAATRLLSAVAMLFLGAMIWNQWPSSALWAIGTLVGINLLFAGVTQLIDGLGHHHHGHLA
jgi:uncharacterized membrane protein HdeD (DUF308 family)